MGKHVVAGGRCIVLRVVVDYCDSGGVSGGDTAVRDGDRKLSEEECESAGKCAVKNSERSKRPLEKSSMVFFILVSG